MMKLLLTGKNGQLGFELQRSLAPLGEIVAVSTTDCDLASTEATRTLVRAVMPDVIINSAAYTAVDNAESDTDNAFAINTTAPGILGEEAAKIGSCVIHYSTDYVFDGSKEGFYHEYDIPNPQSVYGRSKLAGEQALQASGTNSLILRTSWVVGAHGNNFARTILRLASSRTSLNVIADQHGAPTSARLLADVTALLIRQFSWSKKTFPFGLYHLAAGGVTTWYQYACYVLEKAKNAGRPVTLTTEAINAVTTAEYPLPARRPANSRLDTSQFRHTFGLHLPDWQSGLDSTLEQILYTS